MSNAFISRTRINNDMLNYVDVWDVSGDVPALAHWHLDVAYPSRRVYCGMARYGYRALRHIPFWIDSASLMYTGSSSFSPQNDASRIGGGYIHTTASGEDYATYHITSEQSAAMIGKSFTILAIARANSTARKMKARITAMAVASAPNEWVNFHVASKFVVMNLGTLAVTRVPGRRTLAGGGSVWVDFVVDAGQCDIDAVFLLPLDEKPMLVDTGTYARQIEIDGRAEQAFYNTSTSGAVLEPADSLGGDSVFAVDEGTSKITRYFFLVTDDADDAHTLKNTELELRYTARFKHLAGEI